MRPFFGDCGNKFQIGKGVIIQHPESLYIGKGCYISHNVYIQAKGKVTIDDGVIIGPFSIVASSNHQFINNYVTNTGVSAPIAIGKGSWICGGVTLTAGVSVGIGCIIGG